jgi:hypothetical protein
MGKGFGTRMVWTVLAAAVVAGSASAQSITGVTGVPAHGSSVTITGSNFGTNANPAPVIWDNFETGNFNSVTPWSSTGFPAGLLSVTSAGANARHGNSSYNTTANFPGTDGWATLAGGSDSPSWYCQYWFKLDADWNWGTSAIQGSANSNLANVKLFRLWSTGSINENFVVAAHGWENSVIITSENIPAQEADYAANNYITNWTKGVWHLFQFEFRDSGLGVADGVFRWWVDGQLAYETTNWITRNSFANNKRVYGLGFFNSNGDGSTDPNHVYMDDAYIDNSWARVELGNNQNYSACTHREIQIPVSWSADAVTVNFNQGSFAPGSTAYLFVRTSTGATSTGREVVIGTAGATGPGQPGKPVF